MLRMRLRLPVHTKASYCPMCDDIEDVFGEHARSCMCGGDRVKRHHLLRNALAARAAAAGLSPELEKPGLLSPTQMHPQTNLFPRTLGVQRTCGCLFGVYTGGLPSTWPSHRA